MLRFGNTDSRVSRAGVSLRLRGCKAPERQGNQARGSRRIAGPNWRREDAMATPDRVSYWNKTKSLMYVMLALWFFFGFVVHMFVVPLNNIVIPIFGFRLGFYMASQGSLIAFVIMLFWFARKQNAIDEEHGVAED
jgi:putative solute:sodium symporter small subunit